MNDQTPVRIAGRMVRFEIGTLPYETGFMFIEPRRCVPLISVQIQAKISVFFFS
jgi:hypothetical protein